MITKKHIIALDFVLVVGILVLVAYFVGYSQPNVIAPIDNFVTGERAVLFSFEKGEVILIDDNPDFSSPDEIYVEDNLVINLKPGIYYWRVLGELGKSEARQLTIESEISLKLRKSPDDKNESYEIVNAGNEVLNVDIYEFGKLSGNAVLEVDESAHVSGTKFIGRENDEKKK